MEFGKGWTLLDVNKGPLRRPFLLENARTEKIFFTPTAWLWKITPKRRPQAVAFLGVHSITDAKAAKFGGFFMSFIAFIKYENRIRSHYKRLI